MKEAIKRIDRRSDGCWIWTGTRDKAGYGKINRAGKNYRAHRFFYSFFKGEIPKGLLVCHSCDVPSCVNPDHLWVGTHSDNQNDAYKKGRKVHPFKGMYPSRKDRTRAKNKRYAEKYKNILKERARLWRSKNKEKIREKNRIYRLKKLST